MTDLQFRIVMLGGGATILLALATIAVVTTVSTPAETLYAIPVTTLVHESPGYGYPSNGGPLINEGCIASDCCAH